MTGAMLSSQVLAGFEIAMKSASVPGETADVADTEMVYVRQSIGGTVD